MDVVGLALPDPEHLIGTALDPGSPKGQRRKFFGEIVSVYHRELFDCVGRGAILPFRAYLLSLRTRTVIDNVFAHTDKYLICITHLLSSILRCLLRFHQGKNFCPG